MEFVITFLEGFISFISPCMLPMLPLYISYFAGGADKKHKVFLRAFSFILGFTVVFSLLGLFAGTLGAFLKEYKTVVNIVGGLLIVVFGLSYLAKRTDGEYRCVGISVRHYLLSQPDALHRRVSRFGAGACRNIRDGS